RLEILKETVPHVARVALLHSPSAIPQVLRLALIPVLIDEPWDLQGAFETMRREHADGLYVAASAPLFKVRSEIAHLAVQHRLQMVSGLREFATAGGLVSYGADIEDQFRRAAVFVDRIFKGADPGQLPIERASRLHLVINLDLRTIEWVIFATVGHD